MERAFDGEYAPVVRNNIFVKDRRPYVPPSTQPTSRPAAAPADPRKDYQLVGIVFEDGLFRAYFTSRSGGPTTRAAPGDALAQGIVSDVYIDAVKYRSADGSLGWVDIGQDLAGGTPAAAAPAASQPAEGAPAATPGAAPAAPPGDSSKMSLEDRMRLRRQQQGR